ncbi:MAG: hypothetical protein AB1502_19380 [Thermodesulfobacteriota bacterium]
MGTTRLEKVFWFGLVIILLSSWILGCQNVFPYRTVREREPEVRQAISTTYRFEDIPLPPGMTLNRKESFLYETRATKTGLLIYEGRGEMEKLSSFFKQQMPKYQWRLVSNFELHNVMLTFIKEGWSSVIYIIPRDDETKRLEIRVGPIEIKILPLSK